MKRVLGTPLGEYLPALGLLLISAAYLVIAYGYSPKARAFPAAVAWIMLALLALDLVSRTQTRLGAQVLRWLNPGALAPARGGDQPPVAPTPPAPPMREFAAVLWVLGFAAILVLLGIVAAVPAFVFTSLRLRGGRGFLVSLATATAVTLFVWLLFAVLLRINLYPGVLFGGM